MTDSRDLQDVLPSTVGSDTGATIEIPFLGFNTSTDKMYLQIIKKLCSAARVSQPTTLSASEQHYLAEGFHSPNLSSEQQAQLQRGGNWKQFQDLVDKIYHSAPVQSVTYTSDEVQILAIALCKVLKVGTINTSLLKLFLPGSPHPLDLQMDRCKNYTEWLMFEDGGGYACKTGSGFTDVDPSDKVLYLALVQVLEKLESRCSALGRALGYKELFIIQHTLSGTLQRSTGSSKLSPVLQERLTSAVARHEDLWLTHEDIMELNTNFAQLRFPRPESIPSSKRSRPSAYTLRTLKQILLEAYNILSKMENGLGEMILSVDESADLVAWCIFSMEHIPWLRDTTTRSFPQSLTTGLIKIENAVLEAGNFYQLTAEESNMLAEVARMSIHIVAELSPLDVPDNETQEAMSVLKNDFNVFVKRSVELADDISEFLLSPQTVSNDHKISNFHSYLKSIVKDVKRLRSKHDEAIRDVERQARTIKDQKKKIEEQGGRLAVFESAAAENQSMREKRLADKLKVAETESLSWKTKYENIVGEPDKIRAEFSSKVQKLHDKVAEKDKMLANEEIAHDLTKQELSEALDKVAKQKKYLDKAKDKVLKLMEERDTYKEAAEK